MKLINRRGFLKKPVSVKMVHGMKELQIIAMQLCLFYGYTVRGKA